jgi:hypothetical protein
VKNRQARDAESTFEIEQAEFDSAPPASLDSAEGRGSLSRRPPCSS